MKKLITVFFLFISATLFAQDRPNEELNLLMQDHPTYIPFNDSVNLNYSVRQVYGLVKKFLLAKKENIDDYYVRNDIVVQTVSQRGDIHFEPELTFPIYHINTFRALLTFKKENPEKYGQLKSEWNAVNDMVGNASKKDGYLEINLATNKIKRTIWK
jgi:hypothetical protein